MFHNTLNLYDALQLTYITTYQTVSYNVSVIFIIVTGLLWCSYNTYFIYCDRRLFVSLVWSHASFLYFNCYLENERFNYFLRLPHQERIVRYNTVTVAIKTVYVYSDCSYQRTEANVTKEEAKHVWLVRLTSYELKQLISNNTTAWLKCERFIDMYKYSNH